MNEAVKTSDIPEGNGQSKRLCALLHAPSPGMSPLPESQLKKAAIPEESQRVQEVQEEAKFRLAQILENLPKDLLPFVEYELQEIQKGNVSNDEKAILRLNELEIILYAESLPKHDIRLIIAGIRHRARQVQRASEEKAREKLKKERAAASAERQAKRALEKAAS